MSTLNVANAIQLDATLRGPVLTPEDEGYDEARSVWNAMIDRRPAIVVRPHGATDVMAAVRYARAEGLAIAVKGGGHNVAGHGVCDGGLLLDLSAMSSVRVDAAARTASVEPGTKLGDLDCETQAHGLATPLGFISSTGVAGLTLGGGFGYLSRKHGLTVDNLRGVDLVSAAGDLVHANDRQHPDLFWGVRGGGGNFGVVTSFEFDLHPLGPQVLAGPIVHDFADAPRVLRTLAERMREAPDEVSALGVLRHAPPAPFVPEAYHGRLVLLLVAVHTGDLPQGEAALAPLRAIGDPVADAVAPRPYAALQATFDGTAEPGARNYWKAHYLEQLNGPGIDVLCEQAATMSSPESVIGMLSLGGAVARRPAATTAYAHRNAAWVVNIQSRWRDAVEDHRHVGWTRTLFDFLTPHATGGAYVNFLDRDEGDARLRAAYGEAAFERLAATKARWDPDNLFHHNQNIRPAAARR